LWWVNTAPKYRRYWAHGWGGQTITVIPQLDLVLVTTSQREGMAQADHLVLLNKAILPHVSRS
jgi:CubicO group peptidase (beta-lactamase class C family)